MEFITFFLLIAVEFGYSEWFSKIRKEISLQDHLAFDTNSVHLAQFRWVFPMFNISKIAYFSRRSIGSFVVKSSSSPIAFAQEIIVDESKDQKDFPSERKGAKSLHNFK
jgi:hypothetical protein